LAIKNKGQWQVRNLQWISELLKKYLELSFGQVEQEFEVLVYGKTCCFNDLALFHKPGSPICVFELKLLDRSSGKRSHKRGKS